MKIRNNLNSFLRNGYAGLAMLKAILMVFVNNLKLVGCTMALIPPFFIDSVVAIGARDTDSKINWVASGFLYGVKSPFEGESGRYYVYLVTNRHVFEGMKSVVLRFNPQGEGPAKEYNAPLVDDKGNPFWLGDADKTVDIAVIPILVSVLEAEGMAFNFFRDENAASIDKMNELGVTEGDFSYVLGFPMGIVGGDRQTVVVRSGAIARMRDMLSKSTNIFLVDTFIFPGNSGGPVVLKPEAMAITGTKSQNAAFLIGIVKSYVTYQDIAISAQTRRPRIIFEENSGLAEAHPIDFVQNIVKKFIEKLKEDRARGVVK